MHTEADAIRKRIQVRRLAEWIDQHDRPEPTAINPDRTLTVATVAITNGQAIVERDTIPATMEAARALLGY